MTEDIVTWTAAIFFTVSGLGLFIHHYLWLRRWPRTTGRVVGSVSRMNSTGPATYDSYPKVRFETPDGTSHEIVGDAGRTSDWPEGMEIELRYNAKSPDQGTMASNTLRFMFSIAFISIANVFWLKIFDWL